MITWYKNQIDPKDKKIYPCEDCGVLRSENEGGKIFTVCDDCWDKHYKETKEYNSKIPDLLTGRPFTIQLY